MCGNLGLYGSKIHSSAMEIKMEPAYYFRQNPRVKEANARCLSIMPKSDGELLVHLFFQCSYNNIVWLKTQSVMGFPIRGGTKELVKVGQIVGKVEVMSRKAPIWGLMWSCIAVVV